SITVAAPGDDPYIDAGSVNATITGATGGNFENLAVNGTPAVTSVTDTIDTSTVTLTATPSVTEGGVITYTASVTAPVTEAPLVVTLANGQTITIPVGASAGSVNFTAPDNVYATNPPVTNSITATSGGNYENLVTAGTPSTIVTDGPGTSVTTTVALTATPTVAEGGQIVYTATLTNAAQTPVSVTLSNGSVITIAAGQTSGSVNVAAPGDDPYIDAGSVNATITGATGGNFENLAVNGTPAVTAVTDTIDTSTVTLTATPSVTEGGVITYTASVTAPVTEAPLVVTLANGQTITIPVGASSGSVNFTAPDNVYATNPPVTNSITATSGGNYENLATAGTPSTTVTDGPGTSTTTTVALSATPTVAEGGQIVYTATLTNAAQTPVSVTLSNGSVITIAAGQTSGSVNVAAPSDDPYIDAGSVNATITGATGGNFENLAINGTPAVTAVTDTIDTSTVTLTATPSVTEGGVITYTASVTAPVTEAPLVVTLANGQTITIPVGASSGSVNFTAPDNVYATNQPVTNSITATSGGNYENLATAGTPSTTVTDGPGTNTTTTVALTATPTVAEGGQIVYTATLTNAAQTPVSVTLSNGSVITIAAGQTAGSITVAAPGDDPYIDAGSVSTTITGATGGNFENLAFSGTPAVTAVTDTIDTSTVTLTATPSVTEGGVITYTASVTAPVTEAPLVVTLANGQTITIPVGASSGSVNFTAPDNVYATNPPVTNSITATSGGNYENLVSAGTPSTTVTDGPGTNTTTTVALTATPTVAEGGQIVYTATLTNAAQTPVSVILSNGSVITIAAGQTAGSITVAAPGDDPYIDAGSVSTTITGATGGNFENLAVSGTPAVTAVTDTIDTSTVTLTATPSVTEGGVITYTASVTAPVTEAPLVVTLANGQTITIPVGASSGSVNFTAPDNVYATNPPVTNSITATSGGNYENLVSAGTPSTTVTDGPGTNTTTTVALSATPTVAEGGQIVYTATLTNAAQTPVSVTLSNGSVITIAAGQTAGSITVAAPGDDPYIDAGSVNATITGATGGNFENLAVNGTPAVTAVTDTIDTSTVTLTATPSVTEGGVITYTASVTAPVTEAPLVVTLANGQTITIPVGASSGSVNFTAPDNVYATNPPVTNSITATSGGNYENLVSAGTPSTTVTDGPGTNTTTTVALSATPTVAEGGQIVYTATLTNAAQTPVSVTLSNGSVITIAAGQTSGSVNVAAPGDDPYIDAGSVNATITGATGGNFENLAVNGTPAVTAVTDTIDTSTVTLTATPSVTEGGVITYTASVTAPVTEAPLVVTLANGQTITIPVGASSGSVNFTAPDNVYATNPPVTNSITATSGGNYENLVSAGTPSTTVTDGPGTNTTTTVALSATPTVAEGGQIVYTATLTNAAQTPVSVTLSNGSVITIAAGQTSGSVNVAAPGDDPYIDAGSVNATITGATGGNFENLAVNGTPAVTSVTDTIDTSTVTLTATPSVTEGGVITYTASVTAPVTEAPLVVTLANGQTITIPVGASSGSVNFTAPDNVYATNPPVTNSITATSGGNYENLVSAGTPSTTVTDGPGTSTTTTVALTATPTVAEGGQIVYTATLTNAAQTPVSVTLSNGSVITIAAGQTAGSITVAAPGDDPYIDAGSVNATITGATGGNFENLAVDGTPAVTAVTDTIDTSTVTLTATPSVTEGGVITYTASVTAPVTEAPLVVTLANGQTITIPVGASSGSVNFTAPDNVYATNPPVTNSITTTSGGNYENLVTAGTPSTTVTDGPGTSTTTTVALSATPTVAEGGQIVYTATLTNAAQTPVSVTLSNGSVITIAAGQTAGSITVAAPGDDPYIDAGSVSTTITGATGGNFENLAVSSTPAVTAVTDTIDTSTVTLTATPSVTEGGVITYTASVTAPVTEAPLVVTLANGQTITIPVGASSGSVNFTAPDNVYATNPAVTNSITDVSGGNYEKLVAAGTPSTTVTDGPGTSTTTTVALSATPTVAEGGQIVYTATLTNAAQTPVSVTLSNGSVITIAAGQTAGSITVAAPGDDPYIDAGSVSTTITGATGGNFENLAVSSTPAVTAVTDTIDTSTVTLTATPSVTEGGVITYTASVTAPVTEAPLVVTLANGQTITIPVGSSSASVDYTAPNNVYTDNPVVTTSIVGTSGGNFESVVPDKTPVSTTVNDTVDTVTVSIVSNGNVTEDQQPVFTVRVNQVLDRDLTVTLSNGDKVVIAAGKTEATYRVDAQGDDVFKDAGSVTVGVQDAAVDGRTFEDLQLSGPATVQIADTISEVVATLTADKTTVTEGGQVTYTVTLTNAQGLPVSDHNGLTFTLTDGTVVKVPAGSTTGTATIVANDDVYTGGQADIVNKLVSVSGGDNFEKLTLGGETRTTTVTDEPGTPGNPGGTGTSNGGDLVTVGITADQPSVAENQPATFTVTLNRTLERDLNVTLSNGATVTVKAGATTATYTLAAQGDDVFKDGETVKLGVQSAVDAGGKGFENLQLSTTPASLQITDTTSEVIATLTADKATVTEGGQVTYTVTLTNAQGLPVGGHNGLTFTLTDGTVVKVPAGSTTGTATIVVKDDAYVGGQADIVNKLTSVSGGDNFEKLTLGDETRTTTVTDEPGTPGNPGGNNGGDLLTVGITADQTSVNENQPATFTVTINRTLERDLNVTLSNGDTVTVKAGATTATYTLAAQGDDVFKDGETVNLGVQSAVDAGGKGFENLQLSTTPATLQITDTTSEVVATLTADKTTVTEGGQVTYTVTLTNAQGLPVGGHNGLTFTLTDGTVVKVPAGSTTGTATIVVKDDAYVGGQADIVNKLTSVSGGDNFEKLTLGDETRTTTVTDEPGTPGNPGTPGGNNGGDLLTVGITADQTSVNENQPATFTVT
ncbi:immunoglobulin-like domain-containing protein, partial [Pseudomonas monteilii]